MSSDHPPRSLLELRDQMIAVMRGDIPVPDWVRNTPKKPRPSRDEVMSRDGALMKLIADHPNCTVSELADMSGREMWSVSRSLQDLARFGFVRLTRDGMWVRVEAVNDLPGDESMI